MPSAYTARLKLEKQASGENSGTWGDLVNYTFNRLDASIEGWQNVNVAGSANVTLISNNATGNTNDSTTDDQVHNRTLELSGALTGNINVFTGDVENSFIVFNNTSGSYTLTFGPTTGTGTVLKQGAKTIVYSDGSTMLDIMADLGDVISTSITPGAVKFANDTGIQDAAGNEQVYFSQASTAVNYLDITNAAAGAAPNVAAIGGDANISLSLMAKGSGTVQASGNVVSTAGLQTMFIPAQAMFGTTTNGAEANSVETTATRPEMKVLDFDASTIEYAQFSVAMPKSWDEDVITFQAFWAPSSTNTGAALIGLQGISVANDATSDVAFPTAVDVTDNGTGALEDVLVSPVSANVTITSAAADTYTYFQVARNATAGGDSFTGDVRLLGIKIFYTTDAANDA
jgi:hypothetical protein